MQTSDVRRTELEENTPRTRPRSRSASLQAYARDVYTIRLRVFPASREGFGESKEVFAVGSTPLRGPWPIIPMHSTVRSLQEL
jgi:hypothetical protein